MRFRRTLTLVCGLAAAGGSACGRESHSRSAASRLALALDTAGGAAAAQVVVAGVDAENLRTLRSARWSMEQWNRLLSVSVSGPDAIPIAGRYAASGTLVIFEPLYPFDRGRVYAARFDPGRLPQPLADTAFTVLVSLPHDAGVPATVVTRILPSAPTVPENTLRLYIEFSAPMSRRSGVGYVHLLDEGGHEVQDAFLPLEADFWNPDHTRYTLFLDPGRVKRGVELNEAMGRALREGRAYALRVDSTWTDANGLPLAHSFRREILVGPPVNDPITPSTWSIEAPRAGTRAALRVTFPRPLDHGLLQRAIGVRRSAGERVPGITTIPPGETEWRFTPEAPWAAGDYRIVVLSILEDPSGNRVGRPFEVDEFTRTDSSRAPSETTLPVRIR